MSEATGSEMRRAGVRKTESLELRLATLEDLRAVLAIEQSSFSSPWPEIALAEEIARRSWSKVVAACCGEQVVGFMIYWIVGNELHLINLAVDPQWRRCGIGAALMEHLIAEARREEKNEVLLEVRMSNRAAKNLYQRFGFSRLHIRRKYYSDTGEDAEVMLLQVDRAVQ